MNKSNTNPIATIAKIYVALDLVWAVIFATFVSVLASQGLSLTGSGTVAATTGGIGVWIAGFFAAAFQGAIFLVVFSVFGALLVAGGAFLSKNDPKLQRFLVKYALTCLGLDVLWAALVGTFAASILAHFGVYVGAAANATTLGSVLLWIIGFVAGFCQGAIFLTVGTLFIVFGLVIYALCKK
ncbi:MAG: hypothetical protein P4L53_04915 [Candidatus Obscuribacterales bacterium]|nr:hypothetical protein [Candidatus Obscuribacterales bacterium]